MAHPIQIFFSHNDAYALGTGQQLKVIEMQFYEGFNLFICRSNKWHNKKLPIFIIIFAHARADGLK
jgi:hypothetical protein